MVIATQNPIELEGTFPLPEAQLDRFLLLIKLGYPDEMEEEEILSRFHSGNPELQLKPVTGEEEILRLQTLVGEVHVEPVLRHYIVQLVQATRTHADVELGASPRASLGLYRFSQSLAAIQGRGFVTPDDVKSLAAYTLSHRMILKSQARLRDRTSEMIVDEIMGQLPVPV